MKKQFKDLLMTEIYFQFVNQFNSNYKLMAAYYGQDITLIRYCVKLGKNYYYNYLAK
jgi:hypothetical protein